MSLHPKQIESVISLIGPERYKHFIKQVADSEVVWVLEDDGWALAATDTGETVFTVWPAKEYAELCAQDEWASYEPSEVSLDEFMNELLPKLNDDGILVGVFYTPKNKGVTQTVAKIIEDISLELKQYE